MFSEKSCFFRRASRRSITLMHFPDTRHADTEPDKFISLSVNEQTASTHWIHNFHGTHGNSTLDWKGSETEDGEIFIIIHNIKLMWVSDSRLARFEHRIGSIHGDEGEVFKSKALLDDQGNCSDLETIASKLFYEIVSHISPKVLECSLELHEYKIL